MSLHDDKAVDGKSAFFLQLRYWIYVHLLFDKTNDKLNLFLLYCIIFVGGNELIKWLLLLVDYVVVRLHYFYCLLTLGLVVVPYVPVRCLIIVH